MLCIENIIVGVSLLSIRLYVNTLAREQISFAFIFKQQTKNAIEAIWEAVGQGYDRNEFKDILSDATTNKYSCLLFIADEEDDIVI